MGFYRDGRWQPDASEIAAGEYTDAASAHGNSGLLCFTEATPTVSGWYWIDRPDRSGWTVEWVGVRPGHKYLAICEECGGRIDFIPVHGLIAKWAGPIPLPYEA